MEYCPDEYINNCKSYPFKCRDCRGNTGNYLDPLLYKPRDTNSLTIHPAKKIKKPKKVKPKKDVVKSNRIKRGYQQEEKLLRKTVRSGAVFNDGDLYAPQAELRIDSKLRHSESLSFTLRKEEYLKGLSQGIDVWAITNRNMAGHERTVYILTEEAFFSLLNQKNQKNDDRS